MAKFKRYEFVAFCARGAAGGGLVFSLPFWAIFAKKIQKWFATVVD